MINNFNYILIFLILVLLFIILCNNKKEHFWDYNSNRTDMFCKYGKLNPNSKTCRKYFNSKNSLRRGIMNNPVGYIKLIDGSPLFIHPLIEVKSYDNNKEYIYYAKIRQYKNNPHRFIYKKIPSNGKELSTGDIVILPLEGKFEVRKYDRELYNYNSGYNDIEKFIPFHNDPRGWTTNATPLQLGCNSYKYWTPYGSTLAKTRIGLLETSECKPDVPKFLDLYMRAKSRSRYQYYAVDEDGTILEIIPDNRTDLLTTGDIVRVETYGNYTVLIQATDTFLNA